MLPWECFHIVQTFNSCFGLFVVFLDTISVIVFVFVKEEWFSLDLFSLDCGDISLMFFILLLLLSLLALFIYVVVVIDEEEWFPKNVFRLLKPFTVTSSHLSLLNCPTTNVQNISEENHQNRITMLVLLPVEDTLGPPPWRTQLRNVLLRMKTTNLKYLSNGSKDLLVTENGKYPARQLVAFNNN